MRSDKNKAFELRQSGMTYRQIEKELVVSRSTLSKWFKDVPWSAHKKKANTQLHISISTDRIRILNAARAIKLKKIHADNDELALKEFKNYKNNPDFVAGLMLYAGEGDKYAKSSIRFSNVDFGLHKIFISFINAYFPNDAYRIKVKLLLYPDLIPEICVEKWSFELKIPKEMFYKPSVIQGKNTKRKLQFGVGTIILVGTFQKKRLLKWIDLYKGSA